MKHGCLWAVAWALVSQLATGGLVWPRTAVGGNWAYDDNFIVLAEQVAVAQQVLAAANRLRRQLALEWLGEELPPSVGKTIITVTLSELEDRGFTWPADSSRRQYHKMWLTGSLAQVTGTTLAHEMTHVVLATRYPGQLPAWAEEGAASLKDDGPRSQVRRQLIQWFARTGNWPDLRALFDRQVLVAGDQAAYAAAASVTRYLLERGQRSTFLAFALAGRSPKSAASVSGSGWTAEARPRQLLTPAAKGWDAALKQYYAIAGVSQLQADWQAWAARRALAGGPPPAEAGEVSSVAGGRQFAVQASLAEPRDSFRQTSLPSAPAISAAPGLPTTGWRPAAATH